MKIVFIGSVKFSEKMLSKLISMEADIAGCVTTAEAGINSDFSDLTGVCDDNGIPCIKVGDINEEKNVVWIKNCDPDIIFCFGFSQIIGKDILEIAPKGVIGYHPALLPRNRGRHPLIWALVLGLEETASTFFFMDSGIDSGDILDQEKITISYEDNAFSLYENISVAAKGQLERILSRLEDGNYGRTPQDPQMATYWRKRLEDDGKIDFRMTSSAIYNLVRGLTRPYVGAHLVHKGKNIKVWKVEERYIDDKNSEFGKVLDSGEDGIVVKCNDGAVCIKEHEFRELPGKGEYIL